MDIPRRNWLKLAAALAFGGRMPPGHAADSPKLLERSIPKTGEKIAAVGLGTWQVFDVAGDAAETAQARETLKTFVGLGGRVVDSSPMYGSSESMTGQLAAELGVESKLFVATKVWTSGREAGIRQMEDSMRRLRVERLDLIQVHNLVDASTHLATLREWKKAGRVRYLGVTHYHAGAHADLEKIIRPGDIDFVQVNYSLAGPAPGRGRAPQDGKLFRFAIAFDPRPQPRYGRGPDSRGLQAKCAPSTSSSSSRCSITRRSPERGWRCRFTPSTFRRRRSPSAC